MLTIDAKATSYGCWGVHGVAALTVAPGPLSGETQGEPLEGLFSFATARAAGHAAGADPAGTGGAMWQGIAEAASTNMFGRLQGIATVMIADVFRPRVGVAIEPLDGRDISTPAWADLPYSRGSFAAERSEPAISLTPSTEPATKRLGRLRHHRPCPSARCQTGAVRGKLN